MRGAVVVSGSRSGMGSSPWKQAVCVHNLGLILRLLPCCDSVTSQILSESLSGDSAAPAGSNSLPRPPPHKKSKHLLAFKHSKFNKFSNFWLNKMVNLFKIIYIAPLSKVLYNCCFSFTHSHKHSHTNGDWLPCKVPTD